MTVKSPELSSPLLGPERQTALLTGIAETAVTATKLYYELWPIAAFSGNVEQRLWELARLHIGVEKFVRGVPHPHPVDFPLSTSGRMLVAELGDNDHQLILEGGVQGGFRPWERLPTDIGVCRTINEGAVAHTTQLWDRVRRSERPKASLGMMATRYPIDERGFAIRDARVEYITGQDDNSYTEKSEAELDLIRDDLKTLESFINE